MTSTTRLATLADLDALCGLLAVLFSQEAEFAPDEAAARRGLTSIIDGPGVGCILVACTPQGEVVGMVNLLWTISTALGQRVALLEDMVVAPTARGGGVGSQLIEAAIATAREAGCGRITLLTDADNRDGQRFYARHGFAASPMVPWRRGL